jgi:uncharacterized membrane protein
MKIRTGLQHLTKSLQELAQQADQEHVEEQEHLKKRARKEEAPDKAAEVARDAVPGQGASLPSMQPFGGAHST